MGIFRKTNVPLDLATSRRLIGETIQGIRRLEPQDEAAAGLKASMLTAARMIEAHHETAAWIESIISRLWGHLDGLQHTYGKLDEERGGDRRGGGGR